MRGNEPRMVRTPLVVCMILAVALAGCLGGATDGPPPNGTGGANPNSDGNTTDNSTRSDNTTTDPPAEPLAWGAPDDKALRPGVRISTASDTCTTAFLVTHAWERYFFATAAHCVDAGGDELDGCQASVLPLGSAVTVHGIEGAERHGTLAYSSWIAMQEGGETNNDACLANDFALVEVAADDWDDLHPAVMHFGGPVMVRESGSDEGDAVVAYGASPLRDDAPETRPRQGTSLGMAHGDWAHRVYLVTPAVVGDSGGPLMDTAGAALGVASTLGLTDGPGSNTFTDVARALQYANQHAGMQWTMVPWDTFDPAIS